MICVYMYGVCMYVENMTKKSKGLVKRKLGCLWWIMLHCLIKTMTLKKQIKAPPTTIDILYGKISVCSQIVKTLNCHIIVVVVIIIIICLERFFPLSPFCHHIYHPWFAIMLQIICLCVSVDVSVLVGMLVCISGGQSGVV